MIFSLFGKKKKKGEETPADETAAVEVEPVAEPVVEVEEPPAPEAVEIIAEPEAPAVAEEEETPKQKKTGFFRRIFGGDAKVEKEEEPETTEEESAEPVIAAEVETVVPEPVVAETEVIAETSPEEPEEAEPESPVEEPKQKKTGFFRRIFGGETKVEKEEEPETTEEEPAEPVIAAEVETVEPEPVVAETEVIAEAPPEEPEEAEPESLVEEPKRKKGGLFRKLVDGLSKTRRGLNEGFERLLGGHAKLDEEFMEELEEVLLAADIGVEITMRIVSDLRRDVKKNLLRSTHDVIDYIKKELIDIINQDIEDLGSDSDEKPRVILVIGVNGSGKTTTIGKLTSQLTRDGKSVLLAAADTFRAAAIDQLESWAKRSNADLVRHQPGSDPSAVVYDALKAAQARGKDVLIADTAGRLHNKANLMQELEKIRRIIGREMPGAPHETLLVLDATTGQNAVNQAKMFHETIGLTGIVLTKLDGTAKGGVVINIMEQLKVPVKLIGVGEGIDDLRPFDPLEFMNAIFSDADIKEVRASNVNPSLF